MTFWRMHMERKLTVLLIEDDQNACNDIVNYIEGLEDVILVGVTNSSEEGINYVHNFLPDAVILDLELHQGSGNGLLFLDALKKQQLSIYPYILVTTNNSSTVTYEQVRQLGAGFIMPKYQADYSAQNVVEFLRMMKPVILNQSSHLNSDHNTTDTTEQKQKRIMQIINTELDKIGVSYKLVGRKYLFDAIYIVIFTPDDNIYSTIGRKYEKSDASVERAMYNAINKAWNTSDIDDLLKHYTAKIDSRRGVPTITEFIFYYANKVKQQL